MAGLATINANGGNYDLISTTRIPDKEGSSLQYGAAIPDLEGDTGYLG